jgi:hypothetical protein
MFLFMAFENTYMVKVLGGHPKEKRRGLKHHTTFYVPQQDPDNTCGFHVWLSMVIFGAQLKCNVYVSAFILLYY